MKKILMLCFTMLLSACASTATKNNQPEVKLPALAAEHARVFFLRDSSVAEVGRMPTIEIDGQPVVDISNASYFYVDLFYGTHYLTIDLLGSPGETKFQYQFDPNKTYYVQVKARSSRTSMTAAFGVFGLLADSTTTKNDVFEFVVLSESEGQSLQRKLKYVPLKNQQ